MSRVDEALARIRRNGGQPVAGSHPVIRDGIVPGKMATEWPDEDGASAQPEAPPPPETTAQPEAPPASAAIASSGEPPIAPAVVRTEPPASVQAGHDPRYSLATLASEKLITGADADAGAVEQFRRLAAQLYLSQAERGTKVVMVASALPGEGKTLTAANLALTLSESYRRAVLLVDGDLRRPCAHQLFQVPNISGLNDGIRAEVERKVPLIRITEHLALLTAGRPDSDPMSVLSSERMQRVLEEAREKFEWVIVDTPPLGVLTDANLLASMADTAILVVRAGRTPCAATKRVIEVIGRERIAGVVLNRVSRASLVPDYAGYYGTLGQKA